MSSLRLLASESGRESCMEGHFLASIRNLPPHFNGLALGLPKKFIFAYVSRFPVSRWLVSCFLEPSTPRASVLSLQSMGGSWGVGREAALLLDCLVWERHIAAAYLPLVTWPQLDAKKSGNCTYCLGNHIPVKLLYLKGK